MASALGNIHLLIVFCGAGANVVVVVATVEVWSSDGDAGRGGDEGL